MKNIIDSIGKNHLIRNKIDIDQYLIDIQNISIEIICGRAGYMFLQTFNFEVEYLLKNSLILFKQGYVDCAYYQLRCSIELSMVVVFLLFEHERQDELVKKWQKLERFPTFNNMVKELKSVNTEFKKLFDETPLLFEEIKEINRFLNKKTHKQSTSDFYRTRDYRNRFKKLKDETPIFLETFSKTFGYSIIIKLIIDPMPLLLTDENIYLRVISPMAGPIRKTFIEKYELDNLLSEFMKTQYYMEFHNHFIKLKKYNQSFIELENFNNIYYDRIQNVLEYFDDLSSRSKLALSITKIRNDFLSICFDNGMQNFVTDIEGYSHQAYFGNYEWKTSINLKLEPYYNFKIDNFYKSRFIYNERILYVNTTAKINDDDISQMYEVIKTYEDAFLVK